MVLPATLAAMIMLPTTSELSFLLKYSASLRKTKCVIREEFEVDIELYRFCGRLMEAMEDFTEKKFKLLPSFKLVCGSANGRLPKETFKTCDSNF